VTRLLVVGALLLAGAPAHAQGTATPRGPLDDHGGLLIGASLGAGAMVPAWCRSCEPAGGVAVDANIGGFVAPRLALIGDLSSVVSPQSDGRFSSTVAAAAVQYWLLPALWLRGGVGLARLHSTGFDGAPGDSAPGISVALGHEIVHDGNISFDVRLHVTHGWYAGGGIDSVAALLAVNRY